MCREKFEWKKTNILYWQFEDFEQLINQHQSSSDHLKKDQKFPLWKPTFLEKTACDEGEKSIFKYISRPYFYVNVKLKQTFHFFLTNWNRL